MGVGGVAAHHFIGQGEIIFATLMDKDELYLLPFVATEQLYLQVNWVFVQFLPRALREDFRFS